MESSSAIAQQRALARTFLLLPLDCPHGHGDSAVVMTALYTSGDIARILDVKVQSVRHILHTRNHIRECHRAGIVKLYDSTALDAVRDEFSKQRGAGAELSKNFSARPTV